MAGWIASDQVAIHCLSQRWHTVAKMSRTPYGIHNVNVEALQQRCPAVGVQDVMQRFVPSVPRANKACYVAVYDKLGSSGARLPALQAMVQ